MALGRSVRSLGLTAAILTAAGVVPLGAQPPASPARDTLPDGPLVFDSASRGPSGSPIAGPRFKVVPMRGLARPYSLAFLPNGDTLITERAGKLRIVRGGTLDPQPISGMPEVLDRSLKGLNDIALHPRFAENRWVYFTYYKPKPGSSEQATAALARARFDGGSALTDVKDVFVTTEFVNGPSAARIVFGRDGMIYLAIGIPIPAAAATASSTSPLPRTRPAISARSSGCATMAACCRIIRSWARPATNRRFSRSASATRWGSSSIRRPERSGKPKTDPRAATS